MPDDGAARLPEPTPRVTLAHRLDAAWRRASLGQRLVAAGATAGTLIGIASILIPLVVVATTRTTSVESLQVDTQQASEDGSGLLTSGSAIEPVLDGIGPQAFGTGVEASSLEGWTEYVVPVDAPWAELWAMMNPNEGCFTQGQQAWLEEHGTVIPPRELTAQLTNTASSGSVATVRDIRAQGQLTPPPNDTVVASGYACIGAGVDGIYAHMTIGVDPVALYDACYAEYVDSCYVPADGGPTPGDPVVFDIRPGETRMLHLTFDQTVDFVGRFVATVEVDGETATIDLSPGAADIVSPVVTRPQVHLTIAAELSYMGCTADIDQPDAGIEGCTLEQWLAILEATA